MKEMLRSRKAKMVVSVILLAVFVFMNAALAFAGGGDITPTLPNHGSMQDVGEGIGKLVTIFYNLIAVGLLLFAGIALILLVEALIETNMMKVNHQREALFTIFFGFAGLVLIPELAHIILSTLGFNLLIG